MENRTAVNRSPKHHENEDIYRYLPEKEVDKLSDEEFLRLRELFRGSCINGGYAAFHDFKEGAHPDGINGDETDLHLFKRAVRADAVMGDAIFRYACLFRLCLDLEISNIYDIGCGQELQAFLLATVNDVTYTGVDPLIFDSFDGFEADVNYVNWKFRQFTRSDRITFLRQSYPCELDIQPNNIGIFFFCMMGRNEEQCRKNAAMLGDFERAAFTIIRREFAWNGKDIHDIVKKNAVVWVNPYEKYLSFYKKALPEYKFYKIGEPNIVFCTKNPVDIKRLERKYTVKDGCVLTTPIGMSLHDALLH